MQVEGTAHNYRRGKLTISVDDGDGNSARENCKSSLHSISFGELNPENFIFFVYCVLDNNDGTTLGFIRQGFKCQRSKYCRSMVS